MKKKEIFWVIGIIIFALIIIFLIFDLDSLSPGSTINLNIYDTYLVMPVSFIVVLLLILIFFGVYLIRMLKGNFKNRSANIIFLIANIFLIIKVTQTIYMLKVLTESSEKRTETGMVLKSFSNTLLASEVFLLILLVFIGIKIGSSYKRNK